MLERVRHHVGPYPEAQTVFTEILCQFFLFFGQPSWGLDASAVEMASKRLNSSKVRVICRIEGDVAHAEFLHLMPFCECESLICMHGYDYRMFSVSTIHSNKKIGASGFDMAKFLGQGMNVEDEPFEDVYSQLEPEIGQTAKSKDRVENWAAPGETSSNLKGRDCHARVEDDSEAASDKARLQHEVMREREERARLMNTMRRLQEENEKLSSANHAPLSPPVSPRQDYAQPPRSEFTITPQDSSSVISRYQRRFMDEGTVLVPGRSGNEADNLDRRTVMTVQNSLVNGFQISNEIAENERLSLNKLRPINGLPRPFTSTRLNFLANIHTAITRAIEKRPDSHVVAMFRVMRVRPELPCDELLYQVLTSTIDRSSNSFSSNAFRLPYVEVGMHVTEDAIVKTFELLYLEYKSHWFQEMKNIMVPTFHDQFRKYSTDTMPADKIRSERKDKHRVKAEPSKHKKKSSSILGF